MADEHVEEQPAAETPAEAPKRKGGGIFRLIKAVAFVSVIVVVQIVVASMLAPSAQDTAKLAKDWSRLLQAGSRPRRRKSTPKTPRSTAGTRRTQRGRAGHVQHHAVQPDDQDDAGDRFRVVRHRASGRRGRV